MEVLESLPEDVRNKLKKEDLTDDSGLSVYLNAYASTGEAMERFKATFGVSYGTASRVVKKLYRAHGQRESYGLRQLEEHVVARLGNRLDSLLAGLQPLLAQFYMGFLGPPSSAGRSENTRRRLTDAMKKYYGQEKRCFVTGILDGGEGSRTHVKNSHIYPRSRGDTYTANLGLKSVDSVENIMWFVAPLEYAIGRGYFVIVPDDEEPERIYRLNISLWPDQAERDYALGDQVGKLTHGDIQGNNRQRQYADDAPLRFQHLHGMQLYPPENQKLQVRNRVLAWHASICIHIARLGYRGERARTAALQMDVKKLQDTLQVSSPSFERVDTWLQQLVHADSLQGME